MGTYWVLVEKVTEGRVGMKTHLKVHQDQEESDDIRRDSPTIHNVIKVLMISTMINQIINTDDIIRAILQALPLDQDKWKQTPKAIQLTEIIWTLSKLCQSLTYASQGCHTSLSKELKKLGYNSNKLNSAKFIYFDESKYNERKYPMGNKDNKKRIQYRLWSAIQMINNILANTGLKTWPQKKR